MNTGKILTFIGGCAVGSAITAVSMSYIHNKRIDDLEIEIDKAINEAYEQGYRSGIGIEELVPSVDIVEDPGDLVKQKDDEVPQINSVSSVIDYTKFSKKVADDEEESKLKESPMKKPYIISPDEFQEDSENYDGHFLTMFKDGVVIDDQDEVPIEDLDGTLGGKENLDQLYKDDMLHIRNEIYGTEYEIVYDDRTYEEYLE